MRSRNNLKLIALAFVIFCTTFIFFSQECLAKTTSYDVLHFRTPSTGTPYIGVYGTRSVGKKRYTVSLDASYERNPLQFQTSTGASGDIIDNLFELQLSGGYGFTKWLDVGANIPAAYITIKPYGSASSQNRFRLGDIRIDSHITLLNPDKHFFGITLIPFINAPTGSSDNYLGTGNVSGGGLFSFSAPIWPDHISTAINLGYLARKNVTRDNLHVDDQFLFGLGLRYYALKFMSFVVEIQGSTVVDNFFETKRQTPVAVRAGLVFMPWANNKNTNAKVHGSTGVVSGYGIPKIAFGSSFRYTSIPEYSLSLSNQDKLAVYELADQCYFSESGANACTDYYALKEEHIECLNLNPDAMLPKEKERCLKTYVLEELEQERIAVYELATECPLVADATTPKKCFEVYELSESIGKTCPTNRKKFDPSVHSLDCFKAYALEDARKFEIDTSFGEISGDKITFAYQKIDLSPTSKLWLDSLVLYLNDHPSIETVKITCISNDFSVSYVNKLASFARSYSVDTYLRDRGIASNRLEVVQANDIKLKTRPKRYKKSGNMYFKFIFSEK